MEMFEYSECCAGLGSNRRGRKYTCSKQLLGLLKRGFAIAEVQSDFMDTGYVKEDEVVAKCSSGIDAALARRVSELNTKTH